jgi:hypothetical protein
MSFRQISGANRERFGGLPVFMCASISPSITPSISR